MKIYNKFDIVKITFPFTDSNTHKVRPALVLSNASYQKDTEHLVLCMITSAKNSKWNNDTEIKDYKSCGLPSPSIIRIKIFSLDCRLVIDSIGSLDESTKSEFMRTFARNMNN